MIQRNIHFLWTSDSDKPLPEDAAKNVETWRAHHPDFAAKVWSLAELLPTLEDFRGLRVADAIRACRFPAMQSNLVRQAVVCAHGGVWNDLKNRCLSPFLGGLLDGPPFFVEHPPTVDLPRDDWLCDAIFGAPKGDDFVFECLTEVVKLVEARSTEYGGVFATAGPGMLMRVMQRRLRKQPGWAHRIVPRGVWGEKMARTGASYNAGGKHWRERQKTEPMYL